MPAERLHKLIAHAGIASRRAAEDWVRQGRVAVDGQVATDPATKADPARQAITVDGRPLPAAPATRTIMLYKPVGVVSTMRDPQGRPTVIQAARAAGLAGPRERLYPIGRLDEGSEGLLLLTNDGDLALHLTHPRYEHEKEYFVLVRGRVRDELLDELRRGGIAVAGKAIAPPLVRIASPDQLPPAVKRLAADHRREAGPLTWLQIVLREGRKRQIRVMCESVGLEVLRLIRTRLGLVPLGDLRPGQGRVLGAAELAFLGGPR